jgi:ABC-type polar amino acid transport system ATPase subunit
LDLCTRVTVLRDGRMIASEPAAAMDRQRIVELMLGKVAERTKVESRGATAREGLLVIDQLTAPGHVADFGLRLSGGEIVAIAGQVGSGASEVLRALAGLVPDARGHVSIAGRAMRLGAPQRSIRAGAVFASNDRKSEGLFLRQSVARNLLATRLKAVSDGGVLNRGRSSALAQRLAGLIGFDRKRLGAAAETLSGGNQQKVFLGRCLEKEGVTLLMFDEPTRGVDVGGRAYIHKDAGGSAKLQMIQFSDAYNPTFVTQAIKGQLQSDQAIDAVYTMGAEQGLAAAGAIEQLGKQDKIVNGSLGLSVNALQALRDGKVLFIADLQPYLDGYYAVVEAYQYAKYGMLPAGEIWTGAQILTKDNVDKVLDVNKKFPGVRGAS